MTFFHTTVSQSSPAHRPAFVCRWLLALFFFCAPVAALAQQAGAAATEKTNTGNAPPEKPANAEAKPDDASKRTDLNLLGKTDTASGESRRNENVQFNLVDNNALKELSVRVGTTATLAQDFNPANNYFSSEFGNAPKAAITLPSPLKSGFHGRLSETHQNSVFSARSFFQFGPVKPAHENDYNFNFGLSLTSKTRLFVEAGQTKIRGSVNGNVLVPKPDERTPLATDPAVRAVIGRWLAAYPKELPNRTDINERALNTNAPQVINNDQAGARLDHAFSTRDTLGLQYQFTSQAVQAFQLVAGQNPNTNTKSHLARITWSRQWTPNTVSYLSTSYDRLSTLLQPDKSSIGPFVIVSSLSFLGPDGSIPIDRAQNQIRYAGQVRHGFGNHAVTTGFELLRRQINGYESNSQRGFFFFAPDFGRSAMDNFRLGFASEYDVAVGDVQRGFRNWDMQFYAGDTWKASQQLTVTYGLRYQPTTRPVEVHNLNTIPYNCDCNNVAPLLGLAYRLPQKLGVVRANYGVHFGEIFPVTFQQVRFNPPGSRKLVVRAPNLLNPLTTGGQSAQPEAYFLAPELVVPYEHQYGLLWEPELSRFVKLQFGYVGSRAHKLLAALYTNRAQPKPGVPLTTDTISERRANLNFADVRWIINGSRGYYDAARATLSLANWHGLTTDVSYWFSKAIDLGANYTNTTTGRDAREARSQWEFEVHSDMKGLSAFDQPHALLWRTNYLLHAPTKERWTRAVTDGWNFSAVVLVKTGTPFSVTSGSDAPPYGNADGSSNDRPNLLDAGILGRTIGNPDTSRQLLPRAAFSFFSAPAVRGNLGRNVFRKGPIRNVNTSLSRTWAMAHEMRLQLRAESINFFNTPQFAEPGTEVISPNFGAITNTLNDGRTFRFTLQLGW
ncbi:MAG: TonB-dependent receptor [Blastocatellia bacterium]